MLQSFVARQTLEVDEDGALAPTWLYNDTRTHRQREREIYHTHTHIHKVISKTRCGGENREDTLAVNIPERLRDQHCWS